MTAEGYVKQYTQVVQPHLEKAIVFQKHAFFHSVPYAAPRELTERHVTMLAAIESEISPILPASYFTTYRYGANVGVNLGLSVAPGGIDGKAHLNTSGSIHLAKFMKDKPDLRNRLYSLIKEMLHETYGNMRWYKRLLFLCKRLNDDTKEERTIEGTPVSDIWLTCLPKHEKVHCDKNVVRATFLFTTKDVTGGKLVFASPTRKVGTYQVNTREIIAGKWAEFPHCNAVGSKHIHTTRTSWTIYLDYRVFGSSWKFLYPKGYIH
jgi:hypothetical protein